MENEAEVRSGLLDLLTEGKPFVLVTVEKIDLPNHVVAVNIDHNIPSDVDERKVLKYLLDNAAKSIDTAELVGSDE